MREIRMLRSTWRGLETWHGRDGVTLANERARQRGTQTSTYTGAPVLDPTWEGLGVKFPGPTRQNRRLPHCNSGGCFTLVSRHYQHGLTQLWSLQARS